MGPVIICDKSMLQALTLAGSRELDRWFYVNIPDLLLHEILGTLTKSGIEAKDREFVASLAKKLELADSIVCENVLGLVTADLLGMPIEMEGRPIVTRFDEIQKADGGIIRVIFQSPQQAAIARWASGEFAPEEIEASRVWRAQSKAVDLADLRRRFGIGKKRYTTLDQVRKHADDMLETREYQYTLLEAVLNELVPTEQMQERVWSRWRRGRYKWLTDFARYGAFCARTWVVFFTSLANELIGTRSTNRIDMYYFYYVPFCRVFASGDRLHEELSPLTLPLFAAFSRRDALATELNELGKRREDARMAAGEEPAALLKADHEIVPASDGEIASHWRRCIGREPAEWWANRKQRKVIEGGDVPQQIKDAMEAAKQRMQGQPRSPRWPV